MQRPADVGGVAGKKIGHVGSDVSLVQDGFSHESVPGLYDGLLGTWGWGRTKLSRRKLRIFVPKSS